MFKEPVLLYPCEQQWQGKTPFDSNVTLKYLEIEYSRHKKIVKEETLGGTRLIRGEPSS